MVSSFRVTSNSWMGGKERKVASKILRTSGYRRWFISSFEHGDGYGDAAKQDQREAEDLECAKVCGIGDGLEEGAADEEAGSPRGDHPSSSQCYAQQHVAEQVADNPAEEEYGDGPRRVRLIQ